MRRLLPACLCALAAAVGCGGDDGPGGALESALSYAPKGSPFVVAIDTDLEGDQYESLQEILDRFPAGLRLERLLADEIEEGDEDVSFEEDVKPLLGNPFVVSATDVSSFLSDSEDDDFVAAIQVEDSEALDRLIEKTAPQEEGEVGGATLYDDDGTTFAVKDDTVIFAGSQQLLEAALERADAGEGIDVDAFDGATEGLPKEALLRLYFDVRALVEQDPDTEDALKVKWVRALRTLGMTASVDDDSADVEFNLKTEGDLTDEELPLASGEESPPVLRQEGEIGFGLRNYKQIVTFFESALQEADPQAFGDYETGKQALSQRYGLDLDRDLYDQWTEDIAVSTALDGSFAVRAEVKDPDAFAATVKKLPALLPEIGVGNVTDVRRRGGLYEAQAADGGRFFFGMSNDVFVAASDAARARAVGSQDPQAVDGAEGSLVVAADAEQLGLQLIERYGPGLGVPGFLGGGLFARPLDELTGSVLTSTDGMRGRVTLTFD